MNETTMCITAGGVLAAVLTAYFGMSSFLFTTPTHHVTFCNRFGAVFNQTYHPGLHLKDPFTVCVHLEVKEQVDSVQNVQCGTLDGIQLEFPRIDVHNLLPAGEAHSVFLRFGKDYDKLLVFKLVQFFVGQQCATKTAEEIFLTGFNDLDEGLIKDLTDYLLAKGTNFTVLKVKYYKPIAKNSAILSDFAKRAENEALRKALKTKEDTIKQENANAIKVSQGKNDLAAAKAKADQLVVTLALEAELERNQKAAEAARIAGQTENLRELELAENKAKIQVAAAKAKLEEMKLEALGNKELLTPEYRDHARIRAITNNAKIYFGDAIRDVYPVMSAWTKP